MFDSSLKPHLRKKKKKWRDLVIFVVWMFLKVVLDSEIWSLKFIKGFAEW